MAWRIIFYRYWRVLGTMIFSLCVPIIDYYCRCILFIQCSINEWKNNTYIGSIKYGSVLLCTRRACNDANKIDSHSTGSTAYELYISGRNLSCVRCLQSDCVHRSDEINEPETYNINDIVVYGHRRWFQPFRYIYDDPTVGRLDFGMRFSVEYLCRRRVVRRIVVN